MITGVYPEERGANEGMSRRAGRLRLSWKKKIAFIVMVNVASLSFLLGMAEFGVRWRVRGGPLAAMRSFVLPPAELPGIANGWLVPDPDLGYRLNPEKDGVNDLGIRHGNIKAEKPDGLFRIIVLGDSVAWGKGGFVDLL